MKHDLHEKAVSLAKKHHLHNAQVVDCNETKDPESGKTFYRYRLVSSKQGNGPAHTIYLNEHGKECDECDVLQRLFSRSVTALARAPVAPFITIQPTSNVLTLTAGQIFDETITVTVPASAGPAKADVYFLADTTGSMSAILGAVQAGASNILAALAGLPQDIAFGVGNYKDFAQGDPYGFRHQVSPTSAASTVIAAITAWAASGGGDIPEAGLFALNSLAVPPGPGIGWRPDSKRIVVWFGDAPSHDPICAAVSGAATVTESGTIASLAAQGITVLAISTATPGLDDDPTANADGYGGQCGAPGGLAGQGTRIAAATGGAFSTGIDAGNVVSAIISIVKAAVGGNQNVRLAPSPSVAEFVKSITPHDGYGPLAANQDHTLSFDVKFVGVPCSPQEQVVTGAIGVVADGTEVASKKVQITTPACAFTYVVKFVCGVQPSCGCACASVQPGSYETAICIHNYGPEPVQIVKRFAPLVLAGAPVGRQPRSASATAEVRITLPAQTASLDDGRRIAESLYGGKTVGELPLTIGILEILATAEIAVSVIHTTSGLKPHGPIAIDLQQIEHC
jgi:hypothetical protein